MPVYSDWIQDDDYEANALAYLANSEHAYNHLSSGYFLDPGTPFAPSIDPAYIDLVVGQANGESTWTNGSIGPWYAVVDVGTILFPGDTQYYAYKNHNVYVITATAGVREYVPDYSPEWDGFEFEDGPDALSVALGLRMNSLYYQDWPRTNVGSVSYQGDYFAAPLPLDQLPPVGSGSPAPEFDVSATSWTGPIFSIPGGEPDGFHQVDLTTDLTAYMTGDDAWAMLMFTTTSGAPTYTDFGDATPYAWGHGGTTPPSDFAKYLLRPPRYRLFKDVAPGNPRRLLQRDDQLAGGKRLLAGSSSLQAGRRLIGYQ